MIQFLQIVYTDYQHKLSTARLATQNDGYTQYYRHLNLTQTVL